MKKTSLDAVAGWLALGAGALDAATGLGLVLAPALVLRVMGVAPLAGDAVVFLRWVGTFVGAVGVSYLWAWMRGRRLLRAVLELTVIARVAVGVFSGVAVARGWLGAAWASVPATDLGLAAVQLWLLAKGALRDE